MVLNQTVGSLNNAGFFDVLLPFLLVFIIVYAVLNRTEILGPRAKVKNINVVMGLIIGALFVAPHVVAPGSPYDLVPIILQSLPQVSVVLIAIVMVLLLFGIWGQKVKVGQNSLSGIIAVLSFLIVLAIFGNAAWGWPDLSWLTFNGHLLLTAETRALIVTILIFAVIIWWVTREPRKDKDSKPGFFSKLLSEIGEPADKDW